MVKILCPMDYSESSVAALKHAASLARGSDGALLILNVVESGSDISVGDYADERNPLKQEVKELLKSYSQGNQQLRFEERRVEGIPASEILAAASMDGVDLIVMGTTGRTGLKRLVLGSVAEEVSRRATCPVLILKSKGHDQNGRLPVSFWDSWTSVEPVKNLSNSRDFLTPAEINEKPTLALLSQAIAARASDIHIDPVGNDFQIRFRIDGLLTDFCRLSSEVGHALLTQLKITANLDISDPFHPKEGRMELPECLKDTQVRIIALPVVDGEAISLRILNRDRLMRSMTELGLLSEAQTLMQQILSRREGIVLVTGPTGSGKTTTLYSMLHALNDGTRNFVSIEDPVECEIPTIRQLQVDLKHEITMASGLKTLLRLDPDVILVGEIRDAEAAETAMRAASSGKYVFCSLHTRDVASTITAIRDLHIDNRSLAANLAGIVSQRLVRRICPECSRSVKPTEQEAVYFKSNGLPIPSEIRKSIGCDHCRGSGHFERIGIFEVVASNDQIVKAIETGACEDELRHLIDSQGFRTLEKDLLQKVADGVISFEESRRVTSIRMENTRGAIK